MDTKKFILSGLGAAAVVFLLGGLWHMLILADFYTSLYGGPEPVDVLPKTCSQGALQDLSLSSEYLMGIVESVKEETKAGSELLGE